MTPETLPDFRKRLNSEAKRLLRQAVLSGPVEVRVKNGNAQKMPDTRTIAINFSVRAEWESVRTPGVSVTSSFVPNRIGTDLFRADVVAFSGPEALAAFVGGPWRGWWAETAKILAAFPALRQEAVVASLLTLSASDVAALASFCFWRSGLTADEVGTLLLREAKAEGMGTKWVEKHPRVVLTAFEALGWACPEGRTLGDRLGFLNPDASQVWVRVDPETAERSGIWDRFSVPSGSFSRLPFCPKTAVILENEATFLKFPVGPDEILIWGGGKAIVATVGRMSWLSQVEQVFYWGDADGAGYLILDRLRKTLPSTRSLLMGPETIRDYAHMGVPESPAEAVTAQMPRLTPQEAAARAEAHAQGLRIEQERLPINLAVAEMRSLAHHE